MKNLYLSFMLIVITISNLHAQATWTQKANIGGSPVTNLAGFSIGNKGYVTGSVSILWEYDPVTNSWSQKANFIGPTRNNATCFSIGTKGYLGTGDSYSDFYEYDQVTNTWTQKADYAGAGRDGLISFATPSKGYMGTGSNGSYYGDMWEYDPLLDTWTQVASLSIGRYHAASFTINSKGYVYGGYDGNNFLNDLWEYDPTANSWTLMSTMPGAGRNRHVAFSIGTKGYVGLGLNLSALGDFYEWDQPTNTWTTLPIFPAPPRLNAVGITIGNEGYVGTGNYSATYVDWWQYGNACSLAASTQNLSCASVCNGTATVIAPDPGAVVSYSWNTIPVQTTQTATGLCATGYTVTMTDTTGCTGNVGVILTALSTVSATATSTEPLCFGDTTGSLCGIGSGGSGTYTSWLWSNGQTSICASGIAGGAYTVTVTDDQACSGTSTIVLSQPAALQLSFSHTDATCPTCPNGNATANINGGTNPYQFNWSNGVTNSAYVPNILPGTYTCCITDANGCTVCDSVVVLSPSLVGSLNDMSDITIYPDPFTDFIQLSSHLNAKEKVTCELMDLSGRLIYSVIFSQPLNNRIDTHQLEAGIYFLRLSSEGKVFARKMVKE